MAGVLVLHKKAAGHLALGQGGGTRVGQRAGCQKAQVFLGGEHRTGLIVGIGGNHHLSENLRDFACRCAVQRLVERNNAAKSAGAIAIKSTFISLA